MDARDAPRVASNRDDDAVDAIAQLPTPAALVHRRGQSPNLTSLHVHLHDRLPRAPRRLEHHRRPVRQPRVGRRRGRHVQSGEAARAFRRFNNRDHASVLLRGALDHLHALVPSPGHGTQGYGREVRPGLHRAFVREPHEGVTAWCEPRPHRASSRPSEQNRREPRRARRVQRDVRQVRRGRPVEAEHQA